MLINAIRLLGLAAAGSNSTPLQSPPSGTKVVLTPGAGAAEAASPTMKIVIARTHVKMLLRRGIETVDVSTLIQFPDEAIVVEILGLVL